MMFTDLLKPTVWVGTMEMDLAELPTGILPSLGPDLNALHQASDPVEVTDDPDLLNWTRQVYQANLDHRFGIALDQIEQGDWVYLEHLDALARRPLQAKRHLQDMISDPGICARGRARAAQVLARLGSSEGEVFLLEALGSDAADLCMAAVEALGNWQSPIDLSQPQFATLMINLLSSPNREIARKAARLCSRHQIPGAEAGLRQVLRDGQGPLPDLAETLAQIATQPESLTALLPHLFKHRHKQSLASIRYSFDRTLHHPDAEIREPLRQALQHYLLTYRSQERFDQHWVSELSAVADDTVLSILEHVIAEAEDPVSRAYAIEGLARLRPQPAVSYILAEIQRDRPWSLLLRLLADYAVEEDFDRIHAVVYSAPLLDSRDLTLDDARLLWETLGSRGQELLLEHLDRVSKSAREWVIWKAQGLSARAALFDLYTAGVVWQSPDDLLAELEQEGESVDLNHPRTLIEALCQAGLVTYFDTETGRIPCQHDDLISWFGRFTAEEFTPDCGIQISEMNQESPYIVQFIYQDRLYRFEAENYGDYYDVEAVVEALNGALEDNGQPERYIGLFTGDQCACFVFADPGRFLPIAQRYSLALSENASEGMWAGKIFEPRVRYAATP